MLIFDEVMTGFRLALGGAQELYGIQPDMTCLGKILGGGLPCGAFGGRAEIMRMLAPLGPVYQAGTLSGNPLAMAAGIATVAHLIEHRETVYPQLEKTAAAVGGGRGKSRTGSWCSVDDQPRRLHVDLVFYRRCGHGLRERSRAPIRLGLRRFIAP